ncbi:hypothetical protein SAMN05443543_102287 [Flavobacterium flevense]|uniref:Uncharacterized protein n=1 Tax=Flavobacterium flevense TaxID=983 RepID=A0A4Y4AUC3_9FLAO|nr:hypothetical protein [Flavobacterium flevense]GEC70660.1 hypothetical protein FFL01_01990 [Flavobacterium flevense]SHL50480.1 hypothetical protein SAMN05443543_102287 [Flavobacterium flevense]
MDIKNITQLLIENTEIGFQITKSSGLFTSTWLIYTKENYYYYFDISEEIIFDENHRYSLEEIRKELNNNYYQIDCEIF